MTSDPGRQQSGALEALTLAQLCGRMLRQPRRTLAGLRLVLRARPAGPERHERAGRPEPTPALTVPRQLLAGAGPGLVLRLLALLLVLWGSHVLVPDPWRREPALLARGALLLLPGMALWLLADLRHPWPRNVERERNLPSAEMSRGISPGNAARVKVALLATLGSALAWRFTAGNHFSLPGVVAWLTSIALWLHALAPRSPAPLALLRAISVRLQKIRWQRRELLLLALLLLPAAGMRLWQLDSVMPEMSSDHVEKIRDAWRVSQGEYNVFFANIGGREPFQMYAMALLAQLPGLGFNFYTLKLLTALEGTVAVLLIAWAARGIVGGRAGWLTGWLAGALVAVSYWHVILSRMGLRIVLTTAVAALLLRFLWRALRHNRREDFLAAGLVIGFGFYTYQATRMLPLVVVAAAAPVLLLRAAGQRLALVRNLAALAIVALAAFVPLGGYALEAPQEFWHRTTSRILGDEAAREGAEDRLQELAAGVAETAGQLAANLRDVLLMFNWKGDISWFSGAPGRPALDPWTGALFLLGLVAWGRRIQRERSVLLLLVPLMLLVMLLPSALALSFPLENPSHTRASGALPAVFVLAALPLAQLVELLRRHLRGRAGQICAAGLVLLVLGGAWNGSQRRYFNVNLQAWELATYPYATAGKVLAAFVAVTDAPGNAFIIAWPHWWDHRAVAMEAGLMEWPNAFADSANLSQALQEAVERAGPWRLDPQRGLLFFLAPPDERALATLRERFPEGHAQRRHSELEHHEFLLYRVPPQGAALLKRLEDDSS